MKVSEEQIIAFSAHIAVNKVLSEGECLRCSLMLSDILIIQCANFYYSDRLFFTYSDVMDKMSLSSIRYAPATIKQRLKLLDTYGYVEKVSGLPSGTVSRTVNRYKLTTKADYLLKHYSRRIKEAARELSECITSEQRSYKERYKDKD
jgi:hypothetical protein